MGILGFFAAGVQKVAAVSLETGIPTIASVPYSILLAFKNLLAVAAMTDYTFPEAQPLKDFLANPEAFAAAAAADAAAPVAAEEAPKEESSEEDDGAAMGM